MIYDNIFVNFIDPTEHDKDQFCFPYLLVDIILKSPSLVRTNMKSRIRVILKTSDHFLTIFK